MFKLLNFKQKVTKQTW